MSLAGRACWTLLRVSRQALLLIPVYLVVALIAVDWYVFVVQWAFGKPHENMTAIVLLVLVFTFVVVMTLWSYFRTISTSSAVRDNPPPADYYPKLRQLFPGQPERVCLKCEGAPTPKPLRTHHCSICGCCVLKMDHHCPWVATCVGFKNYKYFVLFVMWGCLGCCLYLIAGVHLITSLFSDVNISDGFVSLLTSLLTAAFAISLLFFSGFHLHLVLTGQSTIEASLSRRARQNGAVTGGAAAGGAGAGADGLGEESLSLGGVSNGGDLELQRDGSSPSSPTPLHPGGVGGVGAPTSFSAGSKRANWDAVFGSDPWLWFIPLNTLHETGYEFEWLYESDAEEDEQVDPDARNQAQQRIAAALAARDSANGAGGGSGSVSTGGGGLHMMNGLHSDLRGDDVELDMDMDMSSSLSDSVSSSQRSSYLSQDALADEERSMSSLVRDLQMHD